MQSKRGMKDQFRYVVLTLAGKNLDPDRVTRVLNMRPDSSFRRGDIYGTNKRAKQGYWSLEGRPSGSRIDTQMVSIIRRIGPVKQALRRLIAQESVEQADVTIAVMPGERVSVAGYCLPGGLVSEFTSLGIDIAFSISMPTEFKKLRRKQGSTT